MIYKQLLSKGSEKKVSDDDLLNGLKNRDENVVRYVYQTYWPTILNLVKVNSGSQDEAKDVYQECILDFLEKIWSDDFTLTCKLGTFIYSICRNKWLYTLRGRQKFVDIAEYIEVESSGDDFVEEDSNLPDDNQISIAINNLGEPCRSLLIGFYYEQLSMEQLAIKLNYKSLNVAKQQKFRCKDRLKTSFTGYL